MQKIEYSQNDFNAYVSLLQTLNFKTCERTPSKKDLSEIILPNITVFFTFLMWVNNTGIKTKENTECRNLIRKALNASIQITNNANEKSNNSSNKKITKEDLDTLKKELKNLDFKAEGVTPSKEELCNVIIPNISNFIALLLWVQETGYETNDNKECRELINTALSKCCKTEQLNHQKQSENKFMQSIMQTVPKDKVPDKPVLSNEILNGTKIQCTYASYDKYMELFQMLNYQANDYVPEINEIINVILPNLPKYIVMLMWIDETGYDTDENIESRKLIRKILMSSLELIEDVKE